MTPAIEAHREVIQGLCRRFGVQRLEVFGSAAAGHFDQGRSDYDFIVDFAPGEDLFGRYFGLRDGLEEILGGRVDLVMMGALKNPYFVQSVNESRRLFYAA